MVKDYIFYSRITVNKTGYVYNQRGKIKKENMYIHQLFSFSFKD